MATLKDQIDGVCKELKVTVKEGGLIAQVMRVLVLEGFRSALPLYGGASVFLQGPQKQLQLQLLLQGDALAPLLLRRGQPGHMPRALITP